ncbi:MAG: hypothetical protein WAZ96_00545, partial [Candidatus Moraniibacteriota bacterium]
MKTVETVKTEIPVVKSAEWFSEGNVATIEPVELNKTYKAPQNNKVTVTFTKLPEKAGSLVVKEIKLSAEEMLSLGALSDTAYDITSNMENGTFEYDLTLPYPDKDSDGKAEVGGNAKNEVKADDLQVLFTEDKSGDLKKDDMTEVKDDKDTNTSKKVIEIKGLNHFTIFVVTNPVWTTDPLCDVLSCFNSLQTAINTASAGDTIFVREGAYNESVTVNKDLTFQTALTGTATPISFSGSFTVNSGVTLTMVAHNETFSADGAFTNNGEIVSTTAGEDLIFASGGDFTVGDVFSAADVSVESTGGDILDDGNQTTVISAVDIELSAPAGNIGSAIHPATTVANFNNAIDVEVIGTVNASAQGNVYVSETDDASINTSDYVLDSSVLGSYVGLANLTAAGDVTVNGPLDADAQIEILAKGDVSVANAMVITSDYVGILALGDVNLDESVTASGASSLVEVKAGFDTGSGSIVDDGDQSTTISAIDVELSAGGTGNIGSITDGPISKDFLSAVDVAMDGGNLNATATGNNVYVTETEKSNILPDILKYTLTGANENLSVSKVFSGASSLSSSDGKLTIADGDSTGTILIGQYAGNPPAGALDVAVSFGTYYEVQSVGSISSSVSVTMNYDEGQAVAALGAESKITGVYFNDGDWNLYPTPTIDTTANTISFSASHLTPMVAGGDIIAPSGYTVNIDQTSINDSNKAAMSFTFASAELGATYNYSIDDTDVGTAAVTGTGTISTATDQITGI